MADGNTTEVTYDVSDAVDQLGKLDDAVKRSADNAEKAFKSQGAASDSAAASTADWVEGISEGAFALNQVVEGVTTAAKAVYELTAAVATSTFGFETAANATDDFIDKLERLQQVRDSLAGGQDAAASFQFTRALEDLRLEQAGRGARQGEIGQERAILQERLQEQESFYKNLDSIADKSAKTRIDLEKKANSIRENLQDRKILAEAGKFEGGAQVSKLLQAAEALSKGGEFDRAERIIQAAEKAAGGNAFNQRRVNTATESLAADIEAAAKAAGEKEQADRAAATAARDAANATRDRIAALKLEAAELAAVNKLEKEKQKQLQVGSAAEGRRQTRAEGSREAENLLPQLQELAEARRSLTEFAFDTFSGLATGDLLIPGEEMKEQIAAVELLSRALDNLQGKLGEGATIGNFENAAPDIERFVAALAELRGNDSLADSLVPDLDRLTKAEEVLKRLGEAVAKERAGGADVSTPLIDPSTKTSAVDVSTETGAIQSDIDKAQQGAALLEQHFKGAAEAAKGIRVPSIGTGISPIAPTPTTPAAQTPAAPVRTTQNINVSANIQGGMIDPQTVRLITEIVNREIRKGTAETQNA